jgi:hypothetical protein
LKVRIKDDHNILMNAANTQDHVLEIERRVRVLKERVLASYHSLPFTKLPVQNLVMEAAKKLNFFPPRGSVSSAFSPCVAGAT